MATTAVLSALSFWQATRFADDDVERRERARVASMETAEDTRHVRALIGFDLDLTTRLCAATTERDAALVDLLAANENDARPYVNSLVAQNLRAQNLWSLLQADYPATACASGEGGATGNADAYSAERAHERLVVFDPTLATGDSARVAATPEGDANQSERRLMVAAVAFAMALLLLTASDLASHRGHTARGSRPVPRLGRWAWAWGALALAAGALGIGLVVSETGPAATAVWFVAIV
ncbi:MAG: hypothetical protein ACRDQD_31885, partial [Nocardioidaceae bacterium]